MPASTWSLGVDPPVANTAAEKMVAVLTLDYLRSEAAQGRREDFLYLLDQVPDAPPPAGDAWPADSSPAAASGGDHAAHS
jgi:hypothetical protein